MKRPCAPPGGERPVRGSFALALAIAASDVHAQPRPRRPSCTTTLHPLADLDADPSAPGLLGLHARGGLLVYRDRAGALRSYALDASWRRQGEVREFAHPVGPFTGVGDRGGLAALYLERERELVLARLGPEGEALNVPRVLARVEGPVGSLALTRTAWGFVAAWGSAAAVSFLALDRSGVPSTPVRVLPGASAPSLSWLPSASLAVLRVTLPNGEGLALTLDPTATETSRLRWPSGVQGPVDLPSGTYVAHRSAQGPSLVRVPSGGPVPEEPDDAPGTRTLWVSVGEGELVGVVEREGEARATAGLLSPSGAVAVFASLHLSPWASALGPRPSLVVLGRDGQRRWSLAEVRCQGP
ncbi:MAG: hypothetical protein HY909_25520 [Deltaproteobacteria bacterium]|nr:hypothetical protein [Deltaproteobacteria bacterium]